MYNYSDQIYAFRKDKVRLPEAFKRKLFDHRDSNRNRLISRLPKRIEGLTISKNSFRPQGSMAVNTIIQTKFVNEEYDIDDGLVLRKEELVDEDGKFLSTHDVKTHVLKSLKDRRFVKQPLMTSNAVRVFYREEDVEKHHVDFATYRKFEDDEGNEIKELASENEWIESDPTQVNRWFWTRWRNAIKRKMVGGLS